MKKNVYQTKYWHNHFNCVDRSISKIFHFMCNFQQISRFVLLLLSLHLNFENVILKISF